MSMFSTRDRVGKAATKVVILGGGAAGAAASSPMAGAVGLTTIPWLTKLAAYFGMTLAAPTPLGWTLVCAMAGSVIAALACRTHRAAGASEAVLQRRFLTRQEADERFQRLLLSLRPGEDRTRVRVELNNAVKSGCLERRDSQKLLEEFRSGSISAAEILRAIRS